MINHSFRHALIFAMSFSMLTSTGAVAETVFATEGDYPPWNETNAEGHFTGFDIDLVNGLCAELGEDCRFVTAAFPAMIDAVGEGAYEGIVSGIAITDEREKKIAFTRPYMSLSLSFATAAGSPLAADAPASNAGLLERLAAARLGAQSGSVNARLLEKFLPDATLISFDSQEGLNRAVADGKVDAGLAASQTWKAPTPVTVDAIVEIGAPLTSIDYPMIGRGLGIGLAKENTKLKGALDTAICALSANGEIAALSRRWFGEDLSVPCK